MATAAPAAYASTQCPYATPPKAPVAPNFPLQPASLDSSAPIETAAKDGNNVAIEDPAAASSSQSKALNNPSNNNNSDGGDITKQLPSTSHG